MRWSSWRRAFECSRNIVDRRPAGGAAADAQVRVDSNRAWTGSCPSSIWPVHDDFNATAERRGCGRRRETELGVVPQMSMLQLHADGGAQRCGRRRSPDPTIDGLATRGHCRWSVALPRHPARWVDNTMVGRVQLHAARSHAASAIASGAATTSDTHGESGGRGWACTTRHATDTASGHSSSLPCACVPYATFTCRAAVPATS